MNDRPDPGRPLRGRHHSIGPDTERLAAARVAPRSGSQRARVLEMFRAHPEGLTDYELWTLGQIGARPHVPATRREELIFDGWPIVDSGRRRLTDTGTPAVVWVLIEEGPLSGLTMTEAREAVGRCSREELALLVSLTPHECALLLEAKYVGATILVPKPPTVDPDRWTFL